MFWIRMLSIYFKFIKILLFRIGFNKKVQLSQIFRLLVCD